MLTAKTLTKQPIFTSYKGEEEEEDEEEDYRQFIQFLKEENLTQDQEDLTVLDDLFDPSEEEMSLQGKRKGTSKEKSKKGLVVSKKLKSQESGKSVTEPYGPKPSSKEEQMEDAYLENLLLGKRTEKSKENIKPFQPALSTQRSMPPLVLPPPQFSARLPPPRAPLPTITKTANSVTISKPPVLSSKWGELDEALSRAEGSLRRSTSRLASTSSSAHESRSPSPNQDITYVCPLCFKDNLNENHLVKHVSHKHFQAHNVVCPICGSNSPKVKDLRIHLELFHGKTVQKPQPPPIVPNLEPSFGSVPIPRGMSMPLTLSRPPTKPAEFITRGKKPSALLGLGRGLSFGMRSSSDRRMDMADALWEFVVNLDLEDENFKRVCCHLCSEMLQPHDTQAVLTCVHTFHADCLALPECPLCIEPKENKKKKKKKKKNSKKKKKAITEQVTQFVTPQDLFQEEMEMKNVF